MLLNFLCILVILPPGSCEYQAKHFVENLNLQGLLFNGVFLLQKSVETITGCAHLCLIRSECQSFYYQHDSFDCRLLSIELVNTLNTTASPGWQYYKQHKDGSCSESVVIVGANITAQINPTPGNSVSYQCVAGFEFLYGTTEGEITCQTNGEWSLPSNPCERCATYDTAFELRKGMYLYPPQSIMDWYPVVTGDTNYITASFCQQDCLGKIDFTCVATYYKPGYCLHTWIRVEDNMTLYSPYYYSDTEYDEYIRLCQEV